MECDEEKKKWCSEKFSSLNNDLGVFLFVYVQLLVLFSSFSFDECFGVFILSEAVSCRFSLLRCLSHIAINHPYLLIYLCCENLHIKKKT